MTKGHCECSKCNLTRDGEVFSVETAIGKICESKTWTQVVQNPIQHLGVNPHQDAGMGISRLKGRGWGDMQNQWIREG